MKNATDMLITGQLDCLKIHQPVENDWRVKFVRNYLTSKDYLVNMVPVKTKHGYYIEFSILDDQDWKEEVEQLAQMKLSLLGLNRAEQQLVDRINVVDEWGIKGMSFKTNRDYIDQIDFVLINHLARNKVRLEADYVNGEVKIINRGTRRFRSSL